MASTHRDGSSTTFGTLTSRLTTFLRDLAHRFSLSRGSLDTFASASWLCVYPILTMLLGNVLLVLVAQGQDVLASFAFSDNTAIFHDPSARVQYLLLLAAFVTWALGVWHMSREALRSSQVHGAEVHTGTDTYTRLFPLTLAYLCLFPATFASVLITAPTARLTIYLLAGAHIGSVFLIAGPLTTRRRWLRLLPCWPMFLGMMAAQPYPPAMTFRFRNVSASIALGTSFFWSALGILLLLVWVTRHHRRLAHTVVGVYLLLNLAGLLIIPYDNAVLSLSMLGLAHLCLLLIYHVAPRSPRIDAAQPSMSTGQTRWIFLFWQLYAFQIAAITGGVALLVLFVLYPVPTGRFLGTPATALLAFTVWGTAWTTICVLIPKAFGLPTLTLVPLVLFVLGGFSSSSDVISPTAQGSITRAPLAAHYREWLAARRTTEDYPVFLIATAGGGLRAAYWTAHILSSLDDASCGEFGRHVYAISGVSGGSLGAATYVAMLADRGPFISGSPDCVTYAGRPGPSQPPLTTKAATFLSGDFLTPVIGYLLLPDALQHFTVFPLLRADRGYALEFSWEEAWRSSQGSSRFSRPFLDLYNGGTDRTLPSLFLNATAVEEGTRIVTTNVRWAPTDSLDFFDDAFATQGISLSAAVHNSARFTYVSPPGRYYARYPGEANARVRGRIVDGGYFENSGTATLEELYDEIVATQNGRTDNLFVILITNEPGSPQVCHPAVNQSGQGRRSIPPLSDLFAPIQAILSTREGRGTLAQHSLASKLQCATKPTVIEWNLPPDSRDVTTWYARTPPLGWFLSPQARVSFLVPGQSYMRDFPFAYRGCGGVPVLTPGDWSPGAPRDPRLGVVALAGLLIQTGTDICEQ
jgi:hypothetical protein